jgi:uncharacterized protein
MRRKDKEITEREAIEAIIRASVVCRLAMADGGMPYIVPLNFGYRDNALFFHSAPEGKKLEILRRNRNVCFELDITDGIKTGETACDWGIRYRSVIGFGEVVFLEDPAHKRAALDIIVAQYAGKEAFAYPEAKLKRTTVFRVDILQMTGKQAK